MSGHRFQRPGGVEHIAGRPSEVPLSGGGQDERKQDGKDEAPSGKDVGQPPAPTQTN